MKYIVTGFPGWLGRGVVDALLLGLPEVKGLENPQASEVHVLVLPSQMAEAKKIKTDRNLKSLHLHEGDVTQPDSLKPLFQNSQDAVLIHLAGIIHPSSVKQFKEINTEGTMNLVKAATDAGVHRAVIMSSNSPIGCNPFPEHKFTEESPYNPYMGYGRSKMLMEQFILEEIKKNKMEFVIIRAPWFYGPNQPERQSLFFSMIKNGKAPIVGSGENKRSMSYIDNLSQGLILAAIHPKAKNEIFWIADENPYTMNEIIDTIEQVLKEDFSFSVKGSRMRLPSVASDVAYVVDYSLQSIGLYHQKFHVLSEMNKNIACSVDKAKNLLGYKPVVSLKEGMRRSIKSALEMGHKI